MRQLLLSLKFQASDHLLYSLVCVGPGRKPERWFSPDEAHIMQILGFLKMCLSFLSIIPEFACKQFDHFFSSLWLSG